MYLAIKEMLHERLRYSLLTGILALIALVVFVLSGLAMGLSQGNRLAIDDWQASEVYLNKNANKVLAASQLSTSDLKKVQARSKAAVAVYAAVLQSKTTKINVSVLATSNKSTIMPRVLHGKQITAVDQVLVSQNLLAQGVKIGQYILLGPDKIATKIVGSYGKSTYSIVPTVYTNLSTMSRIKGQNTNPSNLINGIVATKSHFSTTQHQGLQKLSIADFINNLPGYTAQQSTLNGMIYFLFFIALAIVGIFMFILTLQKRKLFAVMKVQGISNREILTSILFQAALMSAIAVVISLILTIIMAVSLPSQVPFYFQTSQLLIDGLSLFLAAVIGGLASWPSVKNIDPVISIG
ncbi:MAG: ABC transporter permease [Oenococcus sicerae]|uniref:ABC transporter permease n=1 Tax=Oenococcus sicerae TaxID=2203724 RepID=UPI0010B67E8F|nr:hypothetical protein OAL24_01096 [Oenococcus sicerae]